jgi:AsmA protein
MRSAQASLALLPLLRREMDIDAVRIDGLQATVERRKDGTTSVDDLLGRGKGAAGGKAGPASSPGGTIIGAVELKQADITWRDLAQGRTVRLAELDLRAGRYAAGARMPFEASAAVTASVPVLAARVKLEAEVEWSELGSLRAVRTLSLKGEGTLKQQPVTVDATAGQLVATADTLDVRGLTVAASARDAGGTPLELRILAPHLEASRSRAGGERIELSLARRGSEPLEAKLLIDGVGGTAARLEAQSVKISGSTRSAQRATRFELAASLVASVDEQTLRIDRATGEVVI